MNNNERLSARERQIMAAVHRLDNPSAREIQSAVPDAPSYSAIRTQIRILEEKGYLARVPDGKRFRYKATTSKLKEGKMALRNIMGTFFNDSVSKTMVTLLSNEELKLDNDELDRITELIDEARKRNAQSSADTKEAK